MKKLRRLTYFFNKNEKNIHVEGEARGMNESNFELNISKPGQM